MSLYTITPAEVAKLAKARALQVAKYKAAYFTEHGEMPPAQDPACCGRLANVAFVNGTTIETAVRLSHLSEWARTFEAGEQLDVTISPDGNSLTVRRGFSSKLQLVCWPEMVPLHPHDMPRPTFGKAIRLTAPESKGPFTVEFDEKAAAELATLRKASGSNKAEAVRRKAWGVAKQAENEALRRLSEGNERAAAARAVLAGQPFAAAVAFARRCLAARRRIRDAFARPTEWPGDIVPPTYDAGTHISGPDGQLVKTNATCETRTEFDRYAAELAQAEAAVEAYKPVNRRPRWGGQPVPVHGPKYDKLCDARRRALDNLTTFLQNRFAEWLESQGMPEQLSWPSPSEGEASRWVYRRYYPTEDAHRGYSRARNLLRDWPAEAGKLVNAYRETVLARQALEPKTQSQPAKEPNDEHASES